MYRYRILLLCALPALSLALGWTFLEDHPVGVDMSRSAQHFLKTLSDEQKTETCLEFEIPERVAWHFIPKADRKGVQIKEMSAPQREAAHSLLRAALSEVGYDKATKIMALEHILHELEQGRRSGSVRDPERYYFSIFGKPSETDRWGLSVEGHHLSLNFVVDQGEVVSSTPTFMGANPATVRDAVEGGLEVGTRVLGKEEEFAFQLVRSLDEQQTKTALIAQKAPREIRAAGEAQPPQEPPAGLSVEKMNDRQQELLRKLVAAYLESMPQEVRQARRQAIVEADTRKVHFAWAGATQPGVGHYYRVQGPTFVIELVNTQPDAAGNPANHIHCVWRDMKGDFAIPLTQN
jgi:hypothetical protein